MTTKKIAHKKPGTKKATRSTVKRVEKPVDTGRDELIDEVITRITASHGTRDPEGAAFLLQRSARLLERAAEKFEDRPAPNNSLRRNHRAFDGEEGIDKGATVGDLLALMFEAPNRSTNGFLTDLLLCSADEAALISYCTENDDGMLSKQMQRVAFRMEWRARIAIELDKRMRQAEKAVGAAS